MESLGVRNIYKKGIEDNFGGPIGTNGPCGPTTEIYFRNTEIWNIIFNEFYCQGSSEELLSQKTSRLLQKLPIPGVDTGMGLERLYRVESKDECSRCVDFGLFYLNVLRKPLIWLTFKIYKILPIWVFHYV